MLVHFIWNQSNIGEFSTVWDCMELWMALSLLPVRLATWNVAHTAAAYIVWHCDVVLRLGSKDLWNDGIKLYWWLPCRNFHDYISCTRCVTDQVPNSPRDIPSVIWEPMPGLAVACEVITSSNLYTTGHGCSPLAKEEYPCWTDLFLKILEVRGGTTTVGFKHQPEPHGHLRVRHFGSEGNRTTITNGNRTEWSPKVSRLSIEFLGVCGHGRVTQWKSR